MKDEFYAVDFRKQLYETIDQMQADLDVWMDYYNRERTHQGRLCYDKTSIQTFLDSLPMEKQLAA